MDAENLAKLARLKEQISEAERRAKGLTLDTFDFSQVARRETERRRQESGWPEQPPEVYDPAIPTKDASIKVKKKKKQLKPDPKPQPKLSKKEKRRKRAEERARKLDKELRKGMSKVSSSQKGSKKRKLSSSAFFNIYTSTSVFQGGSPGGGKRR